MWVGEWWGFAFFTIIFIRYNEPHMIRHEQAHVDQWRRDPWAFHIKYLWYNCTIGYHDNPYEIEAREAEHG